MHGMNLPYSAWLAWGWFPVTYRGSYGGEHLSLRQELHTAERSGNWNACRSYGRDVAVRVRDR